MPQFENPTVLVTRPKEASERFIQALRRKTGDFRAVIQPAFELVALSDSVPEFEAAIFTSRAGVAFASRGAGRVAYCVGDATAEAAIEKGYNAHSASGSADDLCQMILRHQPKERLLHIRGEKSIGDISTRLTAGGVSCGDHVAYRKLILVPDLEVVQQLTQSEDIIVPLFSAETVSIIADWPLDFQRVHGVAISAAVAREGQGLGLASLVVSKQPNLGEMVALTARLIA